jgi:hypothetical protein
MPRGRGRPRLREEERRSQPVGIRLTKALRDKLETERRQLEGEPSLSRLIEDRLRESFELGKSIDELFGGKKTRQILQIVAERIAGIEISTQLGWLDDRYTFDQVKSMIGIVLEHLRPAGRRAIPKPMRWHASLRKDVENLGRHSALLALACIESARDHPRESDVPFQYRKAALQLGSRLKGSPIDELQNDRQQTRRRIFEYHGKQPPADAGSEEALVRKGNAVTARFMTVAALVSYLKPRLIKGTTMVSMAKIFEGVTGANFSENKPIIIERIKSATKGKLVNHPDVDIDRHVGQILDVRSASEVLREVSDETISDEQHRTMQRRAVQSAASTPKGERK